MEKLSAVKSEWTLSEESFAAFLARLDSEPERAGDEYERLRVMLIRFFGWRGVSFPEECADETLNRVIRKVGAGEDIQDIPTFCHGVARLILLERLRSPDSKRVAIEDVPSGALVAPGPQTRDERQQCFARCLNNLQLESRRLILSYYKDEGRGKINNRLALAENLGVPLNALRSRAQRIRNGLEQCIGRCLKKQ